MTTCVNIRSFVHHLVRQKQHEHGHFNFSLFMVILFNYYLKTTQTVIQDKVELLISTARADELALVLLDRHQKLNKMHHTLGNPE